MHAGGCSITKATLASGHRPKLTNRATAVLNAAKSDWDQILDLCTALLACRRRHEHCGAIVADKIDRHPARGLAEVAGEINVTDRLDDGLNAHTPRNLHDGVSSVKSSGCLPQLGSLASSSTF